MKIRIRWLDAFTYRSPRYIVDGRILHRSTSKRIRSFVETDAREVSRRGGSDGRRMYWAVTFSLLVALPGVAAMFVVYLWFVMGVFHAWSPGLPCFLDIAPFLAGVILLVFVLNRIWLWAMRPQLIRAIHTVGAEHCLLCDYDLRGQSSGARCPECGAAREPLEDRSK